MDFHDDMLAEKKSVVDVKWSGVALGMGSLYAMCMPCILHEAKCLKIIYTYALVSEPQFGPKNSYTFFFHPLKRA